MDEPERSLAATALSIRMLLLDVDGVLTGGGIYLHDGLGEIKRFDVQDGMGITMARCAGLKVGILTGRSSAAVFRRAQELKIDVVEQGNSDKASGLRSVLQSAGVEAGEIAYVGDDIQDIPVMESVGLPIAVANARPEVKARALYVTTASGGHGAVRESVEWLLKLREQFKDVVYRVTHDLVD